jgi:hypothetical protein
MHRASLENSAGVVSPGRRPRIKDEIYRTSLNLGSLCSICYTAPNQAGSCHGWFGTQLPWDLPSIGIRLCLCLREHKAS